MDIKEAEAWVTGHRSMTNNIPTEPRETWAVRIARADAAMTEQAYWILEAAALKSTPPTSSLHIPAEVVELVEELLLAEPPVGSCGEYDYESWDDTARTIRKLAAALKAKENKS